MPHPTDSSTKEHHYAIDAAILLDQCRQHLRFIIEQQKDRVNVNVLDLDRTLLTMEQLLHYHLLTLLEHEEGGSCGKGRGVGGRQGTGEDEFIGHHGNSASSSSDSSRSTFSSSKTAMNELELDSSDHGAAGKGSAATPTSEPLMKTVEDLKKVINKKEKRKRSLSFLSWHHHNEQLQQQQEQEHHNKRVTQRSFTSKCYSRALKAAQKNISTNDCNYNTTGFDQYQISTSSTSINANIINTHFAHPISPPPSQVSNPSTLPAATSISTKKTSLMEKSALDLILFRLIVALQLCLVRIEEANYLLCSGHCRDNEDNRGHDDNNYSSLHTQDIDSQVNRIQKRKANKLWIKVGTTVGITCTSTYLLTKEKFTWNRDTLANKESRSLIIKTGIKALALTSSFFLVRRGWRMITMNARLVNTIFALEDLQHQWMLVQSIQMDNSIYENVDKSGVDKSSDEQCKNLLHFIPFQKSSSSIWESQGAFRYSLVKWTMDMLYASVGTAIKVTKSHKQRQNSIMLPITAAAAASYYALVGPSKRSAEFVSSEANDLIRNAWGVVSLPAIKTLSLQASRLLKGAAIAERIKICGVSCFILSKNPCPVLATAIKRYRRQQQRKLSRLSTILEYDESSSQRAVNINDYPKKDVIFHLTGGGFFAHTIAGDVPYLLDWSSATEAVVICPEYALLPEHTFPIAIEEITRVYTALVTGSSTTLLGLGFRVDRIIVTGESTGGNLAASLCVKLCIDGLVNVEELTNVKRLRQARDETLSPSTSLSPSSSICDSEDNFDDDPSQGNARGMNRLPDALMLCCPALNLSLELSPSRVLGTREAVLPSSLISTISDAYVHNLQISKRDPIVSPYYAPDEILRIFPPTLLYASSEDPLLDDSVHFNARLRSNGVDSDLRAAQNLPHAYWGLGTAGFPEARKVQRECEKWMVKQLKEHP